MSRAKSADVMGSSRCRITAAIVVGALCFSAAPARAGWMDAATGKPVRTIPVSGAGTSGLANAGLGDHAQVGGKNLYWDAGCGTWRDSANGKEVRTIPVSGAGTNGLANAGLDNHANVGGKNLFWQPCPPPTVPLSPVKSVALTPNQSFHPHTMLPPIATTSATMILSIPGATGAAGNDVVVGFLGPNKTWTYVAVTPENQSIAFTMPPGTISIGLVSTVDADGTVSYSSQCSIGNADHLPGDDANGTTAAGAAPGARTITEFPSAAQPGDLVSLHVNAAGAGLGAVWIDDRTIVPVAVSDTAVTIALPADIALGSHQIALDTGGGRGPAVPMHLVSLTADPLETTEPGVVQTVTVHVSGLTATDAATMYFRTADPAQFVSGKPVESSPVSGGIATTQIVGVHTGPAVIQFKLVVAPTP